MIPRKFQSILPLILLLMFCLKAHSQSTYGAVEGLVTDSAGAAIPGAQVTLTNTATGETHTQTTGDAGLFSFVNLLPGQYKIEVTKQGFKQVTQENVVVLVQQTTRVNVTLPVGQASETIQVTAQTPLLQPETSSLGQVVEGRNANELPLNGRNIFSLVEVAPSVVLQGGASGTPVGQNPFSWGNFQIGGAFANQSAEYLDGQPLNIGYINLPVLIPVQDSIAEFKVQTHNLGPEWGKLAGGVLNLSTKGGSNSWHGEAYEYIRNKVLNANDWFANYYGSKKPPFTQNQFGGNLGGPILRDKTFFFFQYEGFRLRTAQTVTTTVPTAAERTGDVSALAAVSGPGGTPIQVVDPCAGAATCNSYTPVNFPGNVIPTGRINPTAAVLLNLYPNPTNGGVLNNYAVNSSTGGNQNQYIGRADQTIHQNQHLFGRFSWWNMLNLPTDPLGTGLCQDRCTESFNSKALALGYNNVINPRTIGNFSVSASRFNYVRTPKNSDYDFTKLGWPAAFNSEVNPTLRTPPTPCIVGIADSITCSQGQSVIFDHDTQYNLSPSVSLVRGRHTLSIGGQFEFTLDNYTQTNIASGAFGFDGGYTNLPFADFLLGWAKNPSNVTNHFFGAAEIPNLVAGRQIYYAGYAGDTFKATDKLTLNLGIRYGYQSPWSERFDRQSYFDPTAVNAAATAASGVTNSGQVELVHSSTRSSRYNIDPFYKMFSPRLGFAYSVDPKTVVRGGYGIFWIPIDSNWATNPLNDPVNSIQTLYHGNVVANTPINTITTPWPNFIPPPGRSALPGGAPGSAAQAALLGQSITIATTHFNYGYMQQWNFDVQREFPGAFVADVAYAGSKGTHLPMFSRQINQLSDTYFAQAAAQYDPALPNPNQNVAIAQQVPNPYLSVASPGSQLSSSTILSGQLDRPYPQYAGVAIAGQGGFTSIYHSLQATLQRRFGGGGTLLAAYTYSKLLSNTDTITSWLETGGVGTVQDWTNLPLEYSISSQDVPQRLIISYVLDLPFGTGKAFAGDMSPSVEKVVSGWGVDGVTLLQKGFPINISSSANTFLSNYGAGLRPNVAANCTKGAPGSADARVKSGLAGGEGWINSSCFATPAPYTFGNEPRVDPSLRAQGPANFDFALFKNTNFGPSEKIGVQFRAEFFNLFNHPQFNPPSNSFPSSNFGQISGPQANNPRLTQFALKILF